MYAQLRRFKLTLTLDTKSTIITIETDDADYLYRILSLHDVRDTITYIHFTQLGNISMSWNNPAKALAHMLALAQLEAVRKQIAELIQQEADLSHTCYPN